MNSSKKKFKKIKNKKRKNESKNYQSKEEDEEEDTGLIKEKDNKNKKFDYFSIDKNKFKKNIIKASLILFIIISINIIYKNKKNKPLRKEIIAFKYRLLLWWEKTQIFFNICSRGFYLYKKRFKKNKKPKFSIIIPVLNKRIYLLTVMRSIQNQKFENIEIIFVDDHSTDGSVELIQKFKLKDKRIVLIQHEINKGTLITRNDGVLKAKGEYILFVDPDDMILDNSLQLLNNATLKYPQVDVIQFKAYRKRGKSIVPWARGYKEIDKIVTQPELCSIMFYQNNKLNQINFFIWGKLIKRKIFIKAIYKLGAKYKNQYMTLYEDVAMLFILLQIAKNYVYVNIYGYLYYSNKISVFENRFKYRRANRTIRDCFLLSEILFDFSKNTKYDKLMALFTLKRIYGMYYYVCTFITSGFEFIYRVLNKFIKCQLLSLENKYLVFKLKKLIENTQKKLRNFSKNEINNI